MEPRFNHSRLSLENQYDAAAWATIINALGIIVKEKTKKNSSARHDFVMEDGNAIHNICMQAATGRYAINSIVENVILAQSQTLFRRRDYTTLVEAGIITAHSRESKDGIITPSLVFANDWYFAGSAKTARLGEEIGQARFDDNIKVFIPHYVKQLRPQMIDSSLLAQQIAISHMNCSVYLGIHDTAA